MPPWKLVLTDQEIYQVIFYEQSFSTPDDYKQKWAPLYTDSYGRNLMGGPAISSFGFDLVTNPVSAVITLAAVLLWHQKYEELMKLANKPITLLRRGFHRTKEGST